MTTGLSVENSFSSMVSVGTVFSALDPEERTELISMAFGKLSRLNGMLYTM